MLTVQLRSSNPIQADARFRCLDGKISVHFRGDTHRLLPANPIRYVMISFNPSITRINSSGDALPITFPILSTERVRI